MKMTLDHSDIEMAIVLGTETLARYVRAYGHYNNDFNNHIKGRFGELAIEKLFKAEMRTVISHFRDPRSDRLCDIEVFPAKFRRLEVKTWTLDNWDHLGRCFAVGQASKLARTSDAIVWCTTSLPYLEKTSDLNSYDIFECLISWIFFTCRCNVRTYSLNRQSWA